MIARLVLVPVIATSLVACSAFTPPKEKPVIEDSVGSRIGTLATTAERRMVLVHFKNDHVCAESSPDVAEAINSSIRAAAEASVKSTGADEAKVSGEIAKQLATSINTLFVRTQGLQLFRDGSFTLCQARMNGDIEKATFASKFDALLDRAVDLIKLEIPEISKRITQQMTNESRAAAGEAKASAAAAARSAEEAKVSAGTAKSTASEKK